MVSGLHFSEGLIERRADLLGQRVEMGPLGARPGLLPGAALLRFFRWLALACRCLASLRLHLLITILFLWGFFLRRGESVQS